MKIVVTGANGYLGQGIVKRLLDDGLSVVATDFSLENVDKRATLINANIFELENPYDDLGQPDVLLHLAWRNGFVHGADSHVGDLADHCSFIKKMIAGGIKRVAVMGTVHEIGFFEGVVSENTPCNPQNMYGIAKNALRQVVSVLCKNASVPMQWLRGYYMVGNSSFGNSIFSKIAAAEKEGKKLFPFTSGLNQYDFIDYDVFCLQTAAAVEQDEITGIINICSGKPQKLSDRVERFIKENNFQIKLDYNKYPDRPYDSKAIWGDNRKILEILKKRNAE